MSSPPGTEPEAEARREREWSISGGSALFFGAKIISNLGYFVAVVLIARGLPTTAERGTVAFVTVTALVASALSRVGVDESTTVFAARRAKDRPSLLANGLAFGLTTAVVAGSVAAGLLALFPSIRPAGVGTEELVAVIAGTVAVAMQSVGQPMLSGCARFGTQAAVTAASPWVYAAAVAALSAAGHLSVATAVGAWVLAQGVYALALLLAAGRGIGVGRPSMPLLRECIAFGVRAWVGSVARFLNARSDQMLMGFISTEAALGIYAVAVNASEVLLELPAATAGIVLAVVARGSDPALGVERTLRAFRAIVVLTAGGCVAAFVLGPMLLPLVFGHLYDDSVVPFLILVPGAFGFAASMIFSGALVGASRPGLSSGGPLVSLITQTALDLLLIPPFGATGAATAATVAFLAGGTTAAIAYRGHGRFEWRAIVPGRADVRLLNDVVRSRLPRRPAPSSS
jgi:O-antigen/teichoic acid export membrane protein